MTDAITTALALGVPCSYCGAQVGDQCTSRGRPSSTPHATREGAALNAAVAQPTPRPVAAKPTTRRALPPRSYHRNHPHQ